MRSDFIETFKIMNGVYGDIFFQLDEGGRRGHDQKLFKKRFRLHIRKYTFGNRVSVNSVSLAITGTRYLQIVLIVKLLILLRSIYCLHWNLELY